MPNIQQIKQIEIDGVLYPVQDELAVETILKDTNTQELIITKRDGTSTRIENLMVGATASSDGQAGYVPTPTTEDYSDDRFLSAKGEWRKPSGLVPGPHTHGHITYDGQITTNTLIQTNDRLVMVDSSDSNKLNGSSITFDGVTTTKALTLKGTWETFSNNDGTVTSITLLGNNGILVNDSSPITTSGTRTISHTNSVAPQTTQALYPIKIDALGHISLYGNEITEMPPTSHTHGNILNNGTLQTTDISISNGDKLVVTDYSNSNKIARTSITFDGSTNTKALTQSGTFEEFLNEDSDLDATKLVGMVPEECYIDTKYSAGTGLSLSGTTFNHSNSVTAGTIGSSIDTSGTSVLIPYATYDAQGHITGKGTRTHKVSVGSNSNYSVYTTTNGELTAGSLATNSPTASNATNAFIDDISLDSKGKITATKKYVSLGYAYVKGTQAAATNLWTGNAPDGVTDYYDGLTIDYFLPFAGTSTAATLLLGSLSAKPVILGNSTSGVTTHFPANSVIRLTYIIDSDLNGGNGAWKVSAYYDSNTNTLVRQYTTSTNDNYPLIFTYANKTTMDDITSYLANYVRFGKTLYANPSTGTLNATEFVGELTGNASTATSAGKLQNTSAIGSTKLPVYFTSGGVPATIDYTIEKSVPSNAVFTDTTYTFSGGTNKITVTPSDTGTPLDVTITLDETYKGTVTSVRVLATSPVVSSSSSASTTSLNTTISLANAYGDTKNPYGTKSANYVLAGPSSGSDAAPSFRQLVSSDIPNLDASKINSGTFDVARIPDLSASKITSGTFDASRIPGLDASKIISGIIDSSRLPSYVDDVIEYPTRSDFPATGESGKIYVDLSTNTTWRWSGTEYVLIKGDLALGITHDNAYFGDYGQIAYEHATAKGSEFSSGLYKITTNAEGHVTNAVTATKSDIGLGNVENTKLSTWAGSTNITTLGTISTGTVPLANVSDASDLKAIEALSGTSGFLKKTAANSWSLDTNTYSLSTHTHTTDIESSTDVSDISLSSNTKYKLTAGGTSIVFTTPTDTNTHRPIQLEGTLILASNVNPLNFKKGSNINIVNSSGTLTFSATDTTYTSMSSSSGISGTSTTDQVILAKNLSDILIGRTIEISNYDLTIIIPNGSDLNDYITPGNYRSEVSTSSQTMINCPITVSGFRLIVMKTYHNSYIRQIIIGSSSLLIYMRTLENNTIDTTKWSNWQLIVYGVKGSNESVYRGGNVNITAANIGLGNVENTKLSTWTGSSNITTIGNITSGSIPLSNVTNADDLKAIESLTGTTGLLRKTASNTWLLDTTQYTTNTGTVTSVEISASGALSVSGSPITTSGTITISHNTSAGYKHIPSGGSAGQLLGYSSSGTATWVNNPSHTLSIESSTGTSSISLSSNTKYKLTAGGSEYIFTTPVDNNTHRPIQLEGTEILGNNTNVLNFKKGSNVNISDNSGTLTFSATDTTYTFAEGTTNGTFKVTPSGGSDLSVAIHGLNDAAYKGVTDNSSSTAVTSTDTNLITGRTLYYAGYVKSSGVTSIATGAGITGGTITSTGTIKADLVSETKLTNAATAAIELSDRVYPIALDKNGKLAVNVPWTNINPSYLTSITDSVSGNGNAVTSVTASGNTVTVVKGSTFLTTHQTVKQDGITGATVNRFGTCSVSASAAAKTVSITTGTFSLEAGAIVAVKFSNKNTANSPTLNVGSTGAKNIFVNGALITSGGNKGLLAGTVIFIYDGTQYHLIGNYYDTNTNAVTSVLSKTGDITLTNSSSNVTITPTTTNVYSMTSAGSVTAGSANVPTTPAVIDVSKFSGGSFTRGTFSGGSFTQGTFTPNVPTTPAEIDTTKFSGGSFTRGAFSGGSFTLGTFSGGSLSMAIDSTDTKLLNITFTAATHAADSFTAATHAADSFTAAKLNSGFYTAGSKGTAATHANDTFTAATHANDSFTAAKLNSGFYTAGSIGTANTPTAVTLPGRSSAISVWTGYTSATAAALTITGSN